MRGESCQEYELHVCQVVWRERRANCALPSVGEVPEDESRALLGAWESAREGVMTSSSLAGFSRHRRPGE